MSDHLHDFEARLRHEAKRLLGPPPDTRQLDAWRAEYRQRRRRLATSVAAAMLLLAITPWALWRLEPAPNNRTVQPAAGAPSAVADDRRQERPDPERAEPQFLSKVFGTPGMPVVLTRVVDGQEQVVGIGFYLPDGAQAVDYSTMSAEARFAVRRFLETSGEVIHHETWEIAL